MEKTFTFTDEELKTKIKITSTLFMLKLMFLTKDSSEEDRLKVFNEALDYSFKIFTKE